MCSSVVEKQGKSLDLLCPLLCQCFKGGYHRVRLFAEPSQLLAEVLHHQCELLFRRFRRRSVNPLLELLCRLGTVGRRQGYAGHLSQVRDCQIPVR